jgi:ankyrin repeat protein
MYMHLYRYLIEEYRDQVDVNALGGDLQSTPIYWAAHRNHVYSVALFLEHRADPNIVDKHGRSAYFIAVQVIILIPIILILILIIHKSM